MCVQALLECEKVDVSIRDCNWMVLFEYALQSKKSEMLLYFFKCMYSSSIYTSTQFLFHFSDINADIQTVLQLLCDSIADVNAVDEDGYTPLAVIVLMNKQELTKSLFLTQRHPSEQAE